MPDLGEFLRRSRADLAASAIGRWRAPESAPPAPRSGGATRHSRRRRSSARRPGNSGGRARRSPRQGGRARRGLRGRSDSRTGRSVASSRVAPRQFRLGRGRLGRRSDQPTRILRADRPPEGVTLRVAAAELVKLDRVGLSFSAPSATTSMPSSCAREITERRIAVRDALPRLLHEGAVDLDRVEGKALQIGERGIARCRNRRATVRRRAP